MNNDFDAFRNLFGAPARTRRVRHHRKTKYRRHRVVRVKAYSRKVKRHYYPKQTGKRKSLHLDRLHRAKKVGMRTSKSGKRSRKPERTEATLGVREFK